MAHVRRRHLPLHCTVHVFTTPDWYTVSQSTCRYPCEAALSGHDHGMTALTASEKGNTAIPHVSSLGQTITGIRQAEESLVRRDVPVERIHTACTYK